MTEPVYNNLREVELAYSSNYLLRYNSTSGGYVSACLLWLFKKNKINSFISYVREGIKFSPLIIYSQEEYQASGSIYQEINLVKFIRTNIDNFISPVAVTCLPCQAKRIRKLFEGAGIECYIISLICSGQMSFECTKDYIRLLGLQEEDIIHFQYRSGGWPGPVKIISNNNSREDSSLWHSFFHSFFYHQRRCLYCHDTFGINADLSVSDPWLGARMEGEKDGKSIVFIFTEKAQVLHKEMVIEKVVINEKISAKEAISSQKFTMKRKALLNESNFHKKLITVINRSRVYRSIITRSPNLIKLHTKVIQRILIYGTRYKYKIQRR